MEKTKSEIIKDFCKKKKIKCVDIKISRLNKIKGIPTL